MASAMPPGDIDMEQPDGEGMDKEKMKKAHAFLGREVFGDTPPKEGMKGSFEVLAVDPESGEAEVEIEPEPMEKEMPETPAATETPATPEPIAEEPSPMEKSMS